MVNLKMDRTIYRSLLLLVGLTLTTGCNTEKRACIEMKGPFALDTLIINAKVWTADGSQNPLASSGNDLTAIGIHGNRIVLVTGDKGADLFLRSQYIRPDTKIIDAGGRRVIPGMTDSHTHIIGGGLQLARLNLRDAKNRDEFLRAIQVEADNCRRKNQWLLGGRWSAESWPDKTQPNKGLIDPVTQGVAVFLNRMDGHQALVNSTALRIAGIDANGPADPIGGEIERDPITKEPTGILKESAMDLVEKHIPPASFDIRYNALFNAMRRANSFGITSVHDMSELDDLDVFGMAHRNKIQTIRITSYLSVPNWSDYFYRVEKYPIRDELLRVAGFKGYMDGSLGSRTAYMHQPFADSTPTTHYPRGQLTAMAESTEDLQQKIKEAFVHGHQLTLHAIGDEANNIALHCYANLFLDEVGYNKHLHWPRIEHAQHLLESDIPLFTKYGVVASMQPFHKADDARYAEKAIGKERLKGSYAFRQLVDAGALVIFGSDWPVVTINPWPGIDSAVNARTIDGNIWLPDHSLTLEEAMFAYTSMPAKAIENDSKLGQIKKEYLADLVILDDDPFTIPRDRLGEVKVWKTIFDGKIVYEKGDEERASPVPNPFGIGTYQPR